MVEIVQVNSADGDGSQRIEARWGSLNGDFVVLGLIGKRNEADKAMGLILERAQIPQMVHSISEGFHMSEQHRASAPSAHAVPGAVDVKIFIRGLFASGDRGAD